MAIKTVKYTFNGTTPTQKNMRQQCRHLANPVTHKMVINMEAL